MMLLLGLALAAGARANHLYSFDGSGNNEEHPSYGVAGGPTRRMRVAAAYADGASAPARAGGPAATDVSALLDSGELPVSRVGTSAAATPLLMLLALDLVDVRYNDSDPLFIAADRPFYRLEHTAVSGVREAVNYATPFLDMEWLYGADGGAVRLGAGGYLNLSAPLPRAQTRWGSDVGALAALWAREHNRHADLAVVDYPDYDDDELFAEARRWNIGNYQHVIDEELVPQLRGGGQTLASAGYDAAVDPSVDTFFAGAAMRFGHAMLLPLTRRANDDLSPFADGDLAFSTHPELLDADVGPVCRGFMLQWAGRVDAHALDALRDMASSPPDGTTADLLAADVQRGRELGLPSYNATGLDLGLDLDLGDLYGDLGAVDPLLGALLEEPELDDGSLGPTLDAAFAEQLGRSVAGDRLWYTHGAAFDDDDLVSISGNSLSDMVVWSTDSTWAQSPFLQAFDVSVDTTSVTTMDFVVQLTDDIKLGWALDDDAEATDFELTVSADWGMVGFGVGETMGDLDIAMLSYDDDGLAAVSDRYSDDYYPDSDESRGGEDNLHNVETAVLDSGTLVVARFRRLWDTGDAGGTDHTLDVDGGSQTCAVSWHAGDVAYHGRTQRMLFTVDWRTGAYEAIDDSNNVYYLHAGIMYLTWCVAAPAGIVVARYLKHLGPWCKAHAFALKLGTSGAFTLAMAAVVDSPSHFATTHSVLGVLAIIVMVMQAAMGMMTELRIFSAPETKYLRVTRPTHRNLGWVLLGMGMANCYLGVDQLWTGDTAALIKALLVASYALVCAVVCFFEWYSHKASSAAVEGEQPGQQLPEYSWEYINERTKNGAAWVVVHGLVVDVHRWALTHPGGTRTLLDAVGTDATDKFRGAAAGSRVAYSHPHSRMARVKLRQLAVGRLRAAAEGDDDARLVLREFTLRSKTVVNPEADQPLCQFVFSPPPGVQLPPIRPGHRVVTFHYERSESVVRTYTALPPVLDRNSLVLGVKVYRAGVCSQLLGRLEPGALVKIQGPFLPEPNLMLTPRGALWPRMGLIAGGAGITPMLQLLHHALADAEAVSEVSLLYLCRTEADLAFRAQLVSMAARSGGRIHVALCVHRPADADAWDGETGKFSARMLAKHMPAPPSSASGGGRLPGVARMDSTGALGDAPRQAVERAERPPRPPSARLSAPLGLSQKRGSGARAGSRGSRGGSRGSRGGSRASRGGNAEEEKDEGVLSSISSWFKSVTGDDTSGANAGADAGGDAAAPQGGVEMQPLVAVDERTEFVEDEEMPEYDLRIMVCGPPGLVSAAETKLLGMGYPAATIVIL